MIQVERRHNSEGVYIYYDTILPEQQQHQLPVSDQ